MEYEELLKNAPEHTSEAFLEYLRRFNKIVFENEEWLVIENFKYHTPEKPWYTAFAKSMETDPAMIESLGEEFGECDLLIKSGRRRSVRRFHVHLIKNGYEGEQK